MTWGIIMPIAQHAQRVGRTLSAIGFFVLLTGTNAIAAESWTCTTVIGGKLFPNTRTTFVVTNDGLLFQSRGIARPKILLNDDRLLIAFFVFATEGTRTVKNIGR